VKIHLISLVNLPLPFWLRPTSSFAVILILNPQFLSLFAILAESLSLTISSVSKLCFWHRRTIFSHFNRCRNLLRLIISQFYGLRLCNGTSFLSTEDSSLLVHFLSAIIRLSFGFHWHQAFNRLLLKQTPYLFCHNHTLSMVDTNAVC
jgi:hypothetical protein